MSAKRFNAIFFSPHFDDAILSAGNLIHSFTKKGQSVLVITIFTKGSTSTQPSAQAFLRQSGFLDSNALFAQRKKEDIQAVKTLGAHHLHLSFVDAGFRTDHPTVAHIFKSRMTPQDRQLLAEIVKSFNRCTTKHATADCHFFAPLAVGNHIDHEIIYTAVHKTWNPMRNWQISFWEDVPYRHRTGETCTRLAQVTDQVAGLQQEILYSYTGKQKHAAINAYTSQITSLTYQGGYCQTYDNHIECYWHA